MNRRPYYIAIAFGVAGLTLIVGIQIVAIAMRYGSLNKFRPTMMGIMEDAAWVVIAAVVYYKTNSSKERHILASITIALVIAFGLDIFRRFPHEGRGIAKIAVIVCVDFALIQIFRYSIIHFLPPIQHDTLTPAGQSEPSKASGP